MDEEIICIGCGAVLQSDDPKKAGYLPKSALDKARNEENAEVYCQRCFRLRHYNEIMPVDLNNDDFLALLNSLSEKKALVVNVVDLFDFSNSLLSSLKRFVGGNDFILVGNKFDLFPKNSRQSKIKDWMRQEANRMGLYPKEIFLVSAKRKVNLESLIAYINKQLENKRQELKGITRLLNSMPKDNPGYHYAKGTERAILKEIEELKDKKQYCKNYIDRKIEGRKIFIRSRSLTKEEKAETVKKIKEGFKALSDYNKTKQ